MMTGNGPLSFAGNSTNLEQNPHSWTKLGNVLYVDQPAGTGFSTASTPNPVRDNERVSTDFHKWLQNFYEHFPDMLSKQVHMIGESYAGIYIPYFAAEIIKHKDTLPIHLRSISLGDGTWGNSAAMSSVAIGSYIRSKHSELMVPDDILSVFDEADETCGFDEVLDKANNYPPMGKIIIPGNPEYINYKRDNTHLHRRGLGHIVEEDCNIHPSTPEQARESILNSTCYGPCATYSTAVDYLDTASKAGRGPPCLDIYDITNNCSAIDPLPLISSYFSRPDVKEALHIAQTTNTTATSPETQTYNPCNIDILQTLLSEDPPPIPPAYSIIPDLTSFHRIHLHIYSGENDFLVNHLGTELNMQNLTWRGTSGWAHPPDQPFYIDNAAPPNNPPCTPTSHLKSQACIPEGAELPPQAGVWGEGRAATYHLFYGAGHSVFSKKPGPMFAFVRDVVVSNWSSGGFTS